MRAPGLLALLALTSCSPDAADPGRAAAESYTPEAFSAAAERLEAALPDGAAALRPGLGEEELQTVLAPLPCEVTEEVRRLYRWRAGGEPRGAPLLGTHRFLPPSEAVAEYRRRVERARDPAWPWEPEWLPLFELAGEHFVTECDASPSPAAPIRWVTPERPESPVAFTSLTTLLETASEWWESGAVRLDDEGQPRLDATALRRTHARLNPGAVFPYTSVEGR